MNLFRTHPSDIYYHTNMEYRKCIRTIFDFSKDARSYFSDLSKNQIIEENEIDEESKDEMYFDWENMQNGLDYILNNTKENLLFQELYELAAATMFSTEIQIGQTILFSYDYFQLFYVCLWHFFTQNNQNLETLPEYQQLLLMFRK